MLHHVYTNIQNADRDISNPPFLRYTAEEKLYPHHAYQHIYAWFLYLLIVLNRMLIADFRQFYRQKKMGRPILKPLSASIIFKFLHFLIYLVFPALFVDLDFSEIIICYLFFSFSCSILIGVIVSLAHVNDRADFLYADKSEQSIEMHWAIHEMKTTCNFATDNSFLNWLLAGLNFQIEHHLFPQVSHEHYPQIAPIVEQVAKEFGVPYKNIPTLFEAIKSHYRILKKRGKQLKCPDESSFVSNF